MSLSQAPFASTPRLLWDAYVDYLCNYQPGSWVGTTASSFRILAVILVLPIVFLTLLDITSYVIARTLGIVDAVKASTSDDANETTQLISQPVPSTLPQDTSLARSSEGLAPEDHRQAQSLACCKGHNAAARLEASPASDDSIRPRAFFVGDEDLQLSGVDVFSPAASSPPSPILPRVNLHTFGSGGVVRAGEINEDEGIVLRRRQQERRSSNA
ncbi:hypothetical protein PAXRUDRAFT_824563 [Paxillus rubicundulus Ve08.2h10]|uniref:Uncharacterized protein n=1 Tax=Paxillus rubicundulus Ve08.2h10 TaxID=930991 RepID=A0A0D0DU83_9AGAM|nr:hypothetical protein PAXRUDRAFT_824563 [Paxillus rubicundulus Ve08.2h10]